MEEEKELGSKEREALEKKAKVLWGLMISLVVIWLVSTLGAAGAVYVLLRGELARQAAEAELAAPIHLEENTEQQVEVSASPAGSSQEAVSTPVSGTVETGVADGQAGKYFNQQYKFEFLYPDGVYVREWVSAGGMFVFIDNRAFEIPDGWGGSLTPLELRVEENKTFSEKHQEVREMIDPDTFTKPRYSQPIVGGVKIAGEVESEPMTFVIIGADNYVLTFSFMDSNLHGFTEDLVDQIVNTVGIH